MKRLKKEKVENKIALASNIVRKEPSFAVHLVVSHKSVALAA